jgi:hypothetical protein
MAALFLIFALLPTYLIRFSIFSVPSTLFEVVIWVAFLYTFWKQGWLHRKNWPTLDKKTGIGVAVLLVASVVALLVSSDIRAGLGLLKGFIIDPILVLFLLRGTDLGEWPELPWWGLGLSGLILAGWGILQWLNAGGGDFRAHGPYESANYLAFYLVPVAMFFVYEFFRRHGARKILGAAELIIVFSAILLTYSRGGLLALAAGVAVWAVWLLLNGSKQWRLVAGAAIIAGLLAVLAVFTLYHGRTLTSDQTRQVIWNHSTKILEQNPVTGTGLGAFHDKFAASFAGDNSHIAHEVRDVATAHDLYLTIWLNLGILGLAALLWLFLVGFQKDWELRDRPLAWLSASVLVAMLVHGAVDAPVWKNDLFPIFWLAVSTPFLITRKTQKGGR